MNSKLKINKFKKMKLLLLTCIEEYENEVKNILKHSGVKAFSYQEVKGYKNESNGKINNWFVSDNIPMKSLMFTVFIENECMFDIFDKVEKFNSERSSKSKIHLACLSVEHTI